MKLQRGDDGGLYWFPDTGPRTPQTALAGPFDRAEAGYLWFVLHYEARLSPKRQSVWVELMERAGTKDAAHMMGLMMALCSGQPREFLLRCATPVREVRDRRLESAGT